MSLIEVARCAALERAKEAGKRERNVCKLRERFGLLEQINSDLTYAVAVNLAQAYHAAQLYSEALNSFTQIVRSKQFPQVCYLTELLNRYMTARCKPSGRSLALPWITSDLQKQLDFL